MKIVKESQTVKRQNSNVCLVIEYPMDDKDINGAVLELAGRYPDKGWNINKKCKELAYVIKGKVLLNVEGKEVNLDTGDVVLIEPGEKYYLDGTCLMFIACNPAFDPKQHKIID